MKNKTTAALLALFLGGIGIHRFYVGHIVLGIFYALFCWTFVPSFIAFIDFICFLVMSDQSFNAKYNKTTVISNHIPQQLQQPVSHSGSVAEELEKLHALKEKGVLTQEEFDKKKSSLL